MSKKFGPIGFGAVKSLDYRIYGLSIGNFVVFSWDNRKGLLFVCDIAIKG
jgi:hypothetical protein